MHQPGTTLQLQAHRPHLITLQSSTTFKGREGEQGAWVKQRSSQDSAGSFGSFSHPPTKHALLPPPPNSPGCWLIAIRQHVWGQQVRGKPGERRQGKERKGSIFLAPPRPTYTPSHAPAHAPGSPGESSRCHQATGMDGSMRGSLGGVLECVAKTWYSYGEPL